MPIALLTQRPNFRRRAPVWFRPAFVALSPAARSALDLADVSLRVVLDRHTRGDWGLVSSDPPDSAPELPSPNF